MINLDVRSWMLGLALACAGVVSGAAAQEWSPEIHAIADGLEWAGYASRKQALEASLGAPVTSLVILGDAVTPFPCPGVNTVFDVWWELKYSSDPLLMTAVIELRIEYSEVLSCEPPGYSVRKRLRHQWVRTYEEGAVGLTELNGQGLLDDADLRTCLITEPAAKPCPPPPPPPGPPAPSRVVGLWHRDTHGWHALMSPPLLGECSVPISALNEEQMEQALFLARYWRPHLF